MEKMGKMASSALTRTKTIIQFVRSKGDMARSSLHHLRHFLNHQSGELNDGPEHPGQENDEERDDAKGFRDKGECLLMNGGDRLKQADRQSHDHGHQQD